MAVSLDRPIADCQALPWQIERQVQHVQHLGRRSGPPFGPAQHRAHAGDELLGAEGLDHVVVGAELETDELVGLLAPGGQHDDRHIRRSADLARDLQPVRAGQSKVEDDQVRRPRAEGGQRRLAATCADDG